MNINKKILLGVSSFAIFGALVLPQSASAFGGRGMRGGGRFGGGEDRFHLVPEEMRQEFRADWENLSDEEKAAMREERKAMRGEKGAAMEEFTGLTREEMREARQNGESVGDIITENGVTQEDAEEFLTEQANNRVENIVEKHDLDESAEQTIRDRIAEFVQSILARWYATE